MRGNNKIACVGVRTAGGLGKLKVQICTAIARVLTGFLCPGVFCRTGVVVGPWIASEKRYIFVMLFSKLGDDE